MVSRRRLLLPILLGLSVLAAGGTIFGVLLAGLIALFSESEPERLTSELGEIRNPADPKKRCEFTFPNNGMRITFSKDVQSAADKPGDVGRLPHFARNEPITGDFRLQVRVQLSDPGNTMGPSNTWPLIAGGIGVVDEEGRTFWVSRDTEATSRTADGKLEWKVAITRSLSEPSRQGWGLGNRWREDVHEPSILWISRENGVIKGGHHIQGIDLEVEDNVGFDPRRPVLGKSLRVVFFARKRLEDQAWVEFDNWKIGSWSSLARRR